MFSLIRTCRVGTSLSRVWTRTFLLMDGKRVRFIIVVFFFSFSQGAFMARRRKRDSQR